MTTKRLLSTTGATIAILLVGCAGDRNRQANDAREAELAEQRERQEARAEQRSETRIQSAEMERERTEATATGSPATQDRVEADAQLVEARASYRAKATERLEKLDAKTAELKALVAKAAGKASTSARDALRTADSQRAIVARQVDDLPRVANENWERAKSNLDQQLDTLERFVERAENEVDDIEK